MIDLDRIIKSALKSGKINIGSKQTINAARTGKAIAFIEADNCPENIQEKIRSYADKSKIPVFKYPSSALDLGLICGKPFTVSAMTIRTLSDPELLRVIKDSIEADELKTITE